MASAYSNSKKVREYRDDPGSSSSSTSPVTSSSSPDSSEPNSSDEDSLQHHQSQVDTNSITNKSKYFKRTNKQKLSTKTPLESIHESDSFNENNRIAQSSSLSCFGVKSYLHEFYNQNRSERKLSKDNYDYFNKKRLKNKRIRLLWKCSFWIGAVISLLGLAFILVGYSVEEKSVFIGSVNNIEIVDRNAALFNEYLQAIRIIGLLGFSFGGFILAFSFILPSFVCYKQCIYKEDMFDSNNEVPIEITRNYNPLDSLRSQVEYKTVQPQTIKN